MKVASTLTSISRNAGGLFNSVRNLNMALNATIKLKTFSFKDEFSGIDLPKWKELDVELFDKKGYKKLSYSPYYKKSLEVFTPEVIHQHGIWLYSSYVNSSYSLKHKVPVIISPRGMLNSKAMKFAPLRKKVAAFLYETKNLNNCFCFHALNTEEANYIKNIVGDKPIAVIPNGVELPIITNVDHDSSVKKMVYIGRLHEIKGLERLLKSWSICRPEGWELLIAGWGKESYEKKLRKLSMDLSLQDNVKFLGSVYGPEKKILLSSANAFVLPSMSEAMSMAILEAWSYKLPVLITKQCNMNDGIKYGGGLLIEDGVDNLSKSLEAFTSMQEGELKGMGELGYRYVEENFLNKFVSDQMKSVYDWAIGSVERPSFII